MLVKRTTVLLLPAARPARIGSRKAPFCGEAAATDYSRPALPGLDRRSGTGALISRYWRRRPKTAELVAISTALRRHQAMAAVHSRPEKTPDLRERRCPACLIPPQAAHGHDSRLRRLTRRIFTAGRNGVFRFSAVCCFSIDSFGSRLSHPAGCSADSEQSVSVFPKDLGSLDRSLARAAMSAIDPPPSAAGKALLGSGPCLPTEHLFLGAAAATQERRPRRGRRARFHDRHKAQRLLGVERARRG